MTSRRIEYIEPDLEEDYVPKQLVYFAPPSIDEKKLDDEASRLGNAMEKDRAEVDHEMFRNNTYIKQQSVAHGLFRDIARI